MLKLYLTITDDELSKMDIDSIKKRFRRFYTEGADKDALTTYTINASGSEVARSFYTANLQTMMLINIKGLVTQHIQGM